MKLKDVFEKSVQFFKDRKIETARLDAELLISHALKIDRVQIYMKYEQPLKDDEVSACREAVRRRSMGEPVAYIVGEKGFYGEIFKVGAGVLIPRPETEEIVEQALKHIKKTPIEGPRILDLGAGTGCIAFSILKNVVEATSVSLEKSGHAFQFMQENQKALQLTERSKILNVDVETFTLSELGLFDIVVSNPPYIAKDDSAVEKTVKKFEPPGALYAEDEGLYFVKSWITRSAPVLKPKGLLLFEFGATQGQAVRRFSEGTKLFSEVQIIKDLSGLDRTLKCVR